MSRFDSTAFMTGILIGATVGAVSALLFAPQQGQMLSQIRQRKTVRAQQPVVDSTIDDSFPASDPPSWTAATTASGTDQ